MQVDQKLEAALGYLNFSDGTPSVPFRQAINELYDAGVSESTEPWLSLLDQLAEAGRSLQQTKKAYEDVTQAEAAIALVRDHVLDAYRAHHRDLLFHLSDMELFQPFFLCRVFETILAQKGPWNETERIASGALDELNCFIGHRPVAVLETDQKIEPYAHEMVAPIPIYFRGVGIAAGPYREMIAATLRVLDWCDAQILQSSSLQLELLDEIALDPRAYDHGHPVNQRPSYQFGEWDPHYLDEQGRFRRFVVRPMILDALKEWVKQASDQETAYAEAAVTLAGTMLLAAGVSGDRPEAHSSESTLATLVPNLARLRDAFYADVVTKVPDPIGARLRADFNKHGQPFAKVRQHINRHLTEQRALQTQQDQLAQVYARMGLANESRQQIENIQTPSVRIRTEIQILIGDARKAADEQRIADGLQAVDAIEDWIQRGIKCGALVDPWNVLGFQGNFNLFISIEDSIADQRVDHLLLLVREYFDSMAFLLQAASASGDKHSYTRLVQKIKDFSVWWDRFATFEVSDVERVCARELSGSALFVARVLSAWHDSGAAAGNVAFWQQHSKEFTTPQAFAQVVDALLIQHDYVASMALLMHWLSQAEHVKLEDVNSSFFAMLIRWATELVDNVHRSPAAGDVKDPKGPLALICKMFDYLEVNAEDYWSVPQPTLDAPANEAKTARDDLREVEEPDDDGDLFSSAYDGVTYRDSAHDGHEGEIIDSGGSGNEIFSMLLDSMDERLKFLRMLARLRELAATIEWPDDVRRERFPDWLSHAENTRRELVSLMKVLHQRKVPAPLGSHDSIVEFDREQTCKHQLLMNVITATVETSHAHRCLLVSSRDESVPAEFFPWERVVTELDKALSRRDAGVVRSKLTELLESLSDVPLLYVSLEKGGKPAEIFESLYVRDVLQELAGTLPKMGLYRETHQLLQRTLRLEKTQTPGGNKTTEFDLPFFEGFRSSIEHLVESLPRWGINPNDSDAAGAELVSALVKRFGELWTEHLARVRVSELETAGEEDWTQTLEFIRKYGREIFSQQFMSFTNLRGLIHQGVGAYLDYLEENDDPVRGSRLVADLQKGVIRRDAAVGILTFIFHVVIENYDCYRDYNTTTTQSDYGENLYILLEFLRLRTQHDRERMLQQPEYEAHGVLARKGYYGIAEVMERDFARKTAVKSELLLAELARLHETYGLRLTSVENAIQDRLVRPLHENRLYALVQPTIEETKNNDGSQFRDRFQEELASLGTSVDAAGHDVPAWVDRLHDEVIAVYESQSEAARALTHVIHDPVYLTRDEFQQQLDHWDEAN